MTMTKKPFAFMHGVYERIDAEMKASRQEGEAVPGTYTEMCQTAGLSRSSIADLKKGVTCA